MLEQLKLSNLALSNQAEVDFTPGMICITGETGAGKSLVVDALSLVLGAKADANLVRQGQKQMEVSALFSIERNRPVQLLLESYGFAEARVKAVRKTTKAPTYVALQESGNTLNQEVANNIQASGKAEEQKQATCASQEQNQSTIDSSKHSSNTEQDSVSIQVVNGTSVLTTDHSVISQNSCHVASENLLAQEFVSNLSKDSLTNNTDVTKLSNTDATVLSNGYANVAEDDEQEELYEEESLVLRRVVSAEGKSKAYINGHMATVSQLKEISECLVAIHGQHASVKLMDEKHQLEIVDNFGKLRPLVLKVNQAYNEYSALRQKLTQLSEEQKAGALAYKQDRYELEELKRLDLKEGDYEELESSFDKAMHQAQFMYAVTALYNLIENGETGIAALLKDRQLELDKVKAYDPAIGNLLASMDTAIMDLYECSAQAESLMAQDMELSSAELEERMSKVHELSRRFVCPPQELYLMTERIEQKVEQFLSLKDQINALTQKVKDSRNAYEALCNELSYQRGKVASDLAQQIGSRIKGLSLPDASFDIVLTRDDEGRPRLNGRDNLCFMFSANLGQELKPLAAVASGGELSRLALIIEVLTASVKSTPTLIFDEVDTGISGRTASSVGSLLKELGQYVQVITVTHLPQVAAKANTQFVVAKFNEGGQVNSTISVLDESGRVEEISRMIGGSVITDTTRKSAYELLNDL